MSNAAFHKALVPVTFAESSRRVVSKAAELVEKGFVEKLVLMSVWDAESVDYTKLHSGEKADALKAEAKAVLEEHKMYLSEDCFECLDIEAILAGGDPSEMILHHVEENDYDLIIMGSKKQNKIQELVFGSVADRITRLVDIPILLIK